MATALVSVQQCQGPGTIEPRRAYGPLGAPTAATTSISVPTLASFGAPIGRRDLTNSCTNRYQVMRWEWAGMSHVANIAT
jgi:hypothetical protein